MKRIRREHTPGVNVERRGSRGELGVVRVLRCCKVSFRVHSIACKGMVTDGVHSGPVFGQKAQSNSVQGPGTKI